MYESLRQRQTLISHPNLDSRVIYIID